MGANMKRGKRTLVRIILFIVIPMIVIAVIRAFPWGHESPECVASVGRTIFTYEDGGWQEGEIDTGQVYLPNDLSDVIRRDGRWIVMGSQAIISSRDGVSWKRVAIKHSNSYGESVLAYARHRWWGFNATGNYASAERLSAAKLTPRQPSGWTSEGTPYLGYSAAAGTESTLVAVGQYHANGGPSRKGLVYVNDSNPVPTYANDADLKTVMKDVVYGGARYVAIGDDEIYYADEKELDTGWSPVSSKGAWNAVVYHAGMFVVVGDKGNILTSGDGVTWANHAISDKEMNFIQVAYSDALSQWVAVAVTSSETFMYTSEDGKSWERETEIPNFTSDDFSLNVTGLNCR